MPQPEMGFAPNPLLTSVGINKLRAMQPMVAAALLPVVPSATPSGTYNEWTTADFLRRNGKQIANYEAVPLGGFSTTTRSFKIKNWGVGTPWTQEDLAQAQSRGFTEQAFKNAKAAWVTTQGLLEMEFRVRDLFQTAANWTTTIGGVTSGPVLGTSFVQWDQAAATPVDDVLTYKRRMRIASGGYEPNVIIMPEEILLALKKNAQLIARATPQFYGGNTPMEVSQMDIEKLFGMRVFVPKSVYNSAEEGDTAAFADIWTRTTMWMGYLPDEVTEEAPSAAITINWTNGTLNGLPQGMGPSVGPQTMGSVQNTEGLYIREFPNLERGAMIIEGKLWRAPVVQMAEAGMTWTATIA
jgi:hypothetical protein